jgi:hypothetical protein
MQSTNLISIIQHLQTFFVIIASFLLIIFLINAEGLDASKDLIMFLLGGIIGLVNPLGEIKK